MKAADVLDSIRKHRYGHGFPLIEELVITDHVQVALHKEAHLDGRRKNPTMTSEERMACFKTPDRRRIDALLIGKSGQRTAIEVKVSRADYKRETMEKRRAWQAITHRFIYAVPPGLITPDEVPDGCGLWYVSPGGSIVIAKKARINKTPAEPPIQLFNALCYRAAKVA